MAGFQAVAKFSASPLAKGPLVNSQSFSRHYSRDVSELEMLMIVGKRIISAAFFSVILSDVPYVYGQFQISTSDCLNISVDTENLAQIKAAISICTASLNRNEMSTASRTELLTHRGIATATSVISTNLKKICLRRKSSPLTMQAYRACWPGLTASLGVLRKLN